MKRGALYAMGAALLLAFATFAFTSFRDTLTPYVSFQDARAMDRNLQVAGALVQGSSSYDDGALSFTIREPATGEAMNVVYHGVKPGNFEEAISIVAIGRYDAAGSKLEAEKLLVKCPSKYQGVEGETKEYGTAAAGTSST
jgi:cytochrome c-type biogenesis protein CcmE